MLFFIISLSTYCLFGTMKYRKSLYMLQQNSYNTSNHYINWLKKNPRKIFISSEIFTLILLSLYFIIPNNYFYLLMIVFYGYLFYKELKSIQIKKEKKPFVVTSRVKRLITTILIIFTLITFLILVNYNEQEILIYYLIYLLFTYLSFLIVLIINIINIPIEKCVYYYYLNQANKKLKNMNNLIKIGITGSYGKTTSKNILNEILNSKYNSFATPKSFNTPYGLMNAINNKLDKFDDVFIAEMGACKKGDITELCNFIKPKYGIITKIGEAHLETFKNIDNTTKEKFRLIEMLPQDGVGILNKDDPYQRNYQIKNNCHIIWVGLEEEADIMAHDVKVTNQGMTFNIVFKSSNQKYELKTSLLGKANIYNILASVALANYLGISKEDIIKRVSILKPTEHRLELKKIGHLNIIDDAFNSNPEGAKMALEVLSLMEGTKVVVTPGMVELGKKQYELNKQLGMQIADVADAVILVGTKQTKPIYVGLKEKKYHEDKISVIDDFKDFFEVIKKYETKNTHVLLENDLPDIFDERK